MDIIAVANGNIAKMKSAGIVPQKYGFRVTKVTTVTQLVRYAEGFEISAHQLLTQSDVVTRGGTGILTLVSRDGRPKNTTDNGKRMSDVQIRNHTAVAVRKYRKQHNLTQEELAIRAGVTRHAINVAETGQQDHRITTIASIADALDESITLFLPDPCPGEVDLAAVLTVARAVLAHPDVMARLITKK